ncbi:MAG TPA: ATP-dependent DNA helicase RecG [bacterium]|nr:ATP-dependent DNA helicase RecG [Chlamydiota bacterium]HOE27828.1 ATP-dependent DNA helicase RecG [bacterium]HQM52206.1 ATP-dependent DNA helicase RecG [bacterium]
MGPKGANPEREDLDGVKVQYVKGVGPRRAALLETLGVRSVMDLLRHYPRRYDDRRQIRRIAHLEEGREETVRGRILTMGTKRLRRGLSLFQLAVGDDTGVVYATWFNQPFLERRFSVGQELILTGKVQRRPELQIVGPEFEVLGGEGNDLLNTGRIVPVYPANERLGQRALRGMVHACLERFAGSVPDILPPALRDALGLCATAAALRGIHFPGTPAELERARRRLVFDEFLLMTLAMVLKKRQLAEKPGAARSAGNGPRYRRFLAALPFPLTGAQRRVIGEIRGDMAQPHPMHRLLQGDVGSGKTVVAAAALLTAVDAGHQGVLMAPTEILAAQHWRTLTALLAPAGIAPHLLIGEMEAAEKEAVRAAIRRDRPALVVGTHAVIQREVAFSRLGIVVVDEQHRFGVAQRARLKAKGSNPDVLVMTATPIPRTLALTLYGDLDVSILDEMPPGRGKVTTHLVPPEKLAAALGFIRGEALKGKQTYIVYPLVEESGKLPLGDATGMAEKLKREVFPDVAVGVLHGRMPREERDAVMERFRAGAIKVLFATSVIEVGLDVPAACIMLVQHAERFGLSQLHQMRGRIGRGKGRSYFLVAGEPATEEASKRLEALVSTTDGFKIAEMDLALRGPGEFFSDRQHGGPDLRLADLSGDRELLDRARETANRIAEEDRMLKKEEHAPLRALVRRNYKGRFLLGVTG